MPLVDKNVPTRGSVQEEEKNPTLLFVGDVMLGRNVELLSDLNGDDYSFAKIGGFLKNFDTVVANLEGPILKDHVRTRAGSTRFSFKEGSAKVLFDQNFRIVSTANNHMYDFGRAGYLETLNHLQSAGISGAGDSYYEGDLSHVETTIEGRRLAFLSLNAVARAPDKESVSKLLKMLRERNEYVVVLVHWGDEYKPSSNAKQVELAHSFVDGGADLVIGHHPHVVEEVERYKNGVIFYSLGNFIFDQYFSKSVQEGLTVSAQFGENEVLYKLYPIKSVRSVPELMVQEKNMWITDLDEKSTTLKKDDLGDTIRVQKISGSQLQL